MSQQPSLHPSLAPRTNARLILVWGALGVVLLSLTHPFPWPHLLLGAGLGGVAGVMQVLSIREAPTAYAAATSLGGVRKVMLGTRWGKRYTIFFWLSSLAFLVLALLLKRNPVLDYCTATVAFKFLRETVAFKMTVELQKAQNG